MTLRELLAVLAKHQAVVDVLRRLAAERADQLDLQLRVGAMVRAADTTSWLLATCPFILASRSFLGVGCSVFSPLISFE